jgi:hypothetical protein
MTDRLSKNFIIALSFKPRYQMRLISTCIIQLFLAITIFPSVFAQPTLQSGNIPNVNDAWAYKTITDTTIQPGLSGTGQTWNYSTFFISPSAVTEQYAMPTGTGNDAIYPSANLKVTSPLGGYDYYIRSASSLQYLGSKGLSSQLVITNVQNLLTVPFQYGNTVSNAAVTGSGISGYPLTGTISANADATGTLMTQLGTYNNVLRVVYDMNVVEGAGTGFDTYYHLVKYCWYRTGLRAPVFQIITFDVSGGLGNSHQKVTLFNTITTGIETHSSALSFSMFPNPADQRSKVSISVPGQGASDISIMDLTGKVCAVANISSADPVREVSIDLGNISKGIYIVTVKTGALVQRQRLVIE